MAKSKQNRNLLCLAICDPQQVPILYPPVHGLVHPSKHNKFRIAENTNEEEVLEVDTPDIPEEIIAILSKFDCFGEEGFFIIATPNATDLPTSNEEKRQMFLDCAYSLACPRVTKFNDRFFNLAFLEYRGGLIEVCCSTCSKAFGNLHDITIPKALAAMRNNVFHHQCPEYICGMNGKKHRTDERVYPIFEVL